MAPLKISKIVSVSSEDRVSCASNLLLSDSFKKWSVEKPGLTKATVVLELESEKRITGVDIGNNGSAFVEILVGKSSSDADEMENLIITTSFMTPSESRSQSNMFKIKMFTKQDLGKVSLEGKWDRIKVVCTQPYNKILKFGLSMITFHGEPNTPKPTPTKPSGMSLPKTPVSVKTKSPSVATTPKSALSNGERKAASKLLAGVAANKEDVSQQALRDLKEKGGDKSSSSSSLVKKIIDISDEPTSSTSSSSPRASAVDFDNLLSDVVIVISGYQNPLRSDLRELALSMGAKYRPDWTPDATHLICAVPNTPKYNQVRGRGIIVKKEWLFACRDKKKRVGEKNFRMDIADDDSDDEDEIVDKTESNSADGSDDNKLAGRSKRKHPQKVVYDDSSSSAEEEAPQKKAKVGDEDSYHPSEEENMEEDEEDAEFYENVDSNEEEEEEEERSGSESSEKAKSSRRQPEKGKRKVESMGNVRKSELPDISDSEEEEQGEEVDVYEAATDAETEDDIIERLQLPALPSFFAGHNIFLHRDAMDSDTIKSITRLIIAYGGKLYEHMHPDVRFIITPSSVWESSFNDALEVRPDVKLINQGWIYKSAEKQESVPKEMFYLHQT